MAGIIVASGIAAFAASSSGTFSMGAGTSLGVNCPDALTNANVESSSETLNCADNATTTTTPPPTTPTTVPPGTTTTDAPATTTTTTTQSAASSNCTSSGDGGFGPYLDPSIYYSDGFNTNVNNQMFSNISETLCDPAQSATQWSVSANETAAADGGATLSYPDVQQLLTTDQNVGQPISGFTSLTSTFNTTNPPDSSGDWEMAYDIWLQNYPSDIMVWVNTSNERGAESSYGGSTVDGQVTIGGVSYTAINYGTERILVDNTNESSGSVDLLGVLKYLQSAGIVSSTDAIEEINFGWEICHTDGQTLNWALNSYTLSASS